MKINDMFWPRAFKVDFRAGKSTSLFEIVSCDWLISNKRLAGRKRVEKFQLFLYVKLVKIRISLHN